MQRCILVLCLLVSPAAPALPPAFPGPTSDLVDLVRPITTEVRFADGAVQRNRGSGFVIGDRYYTAYHNLQALPGLIVEHRILLGGEIVEPLAVDVGHDLAVFVLPASLCAAWCNDLVPETADFRLDTVMWLESASSNPRWERARVRNVAFKGPPEATRQDVCDANLIIEIETPFIPGDSGGPVFDPDTGTVVGLIQGSFEDQEGHSTGYFKPVSCVHARLGARGRPVR